MSVLAVKICILLHTVMEFHTGKKRSYMKLIIWLLGHPALVKVVLVQLSPVSPKSSVLPSQITLKLDLKNNNLQQLSRGAFTLTPYLTHLNLQRCNIIKVKEGAFRTLGRVVYLNLAYNKIDILYQVRREGNTEETKLIFVTLGQRASLLNTFKKQFFLAFEIFWRYDDFSLPLTWLLQESFDGLSSLKELHLDHNRVEEIQPGAFSQLGFLNMLALIHNQLVYIPNMAFQVLRLKAIDFLLSQTQHTRTVHMLRN